MRAAFIFVSGLLLVVAGCSGGFAPIGPAVATDIGFLGCQVGPEPGVTVREGDPLALGEPMAFSGIEHMTPAQAGEAIRARGLNVTWRYEYAIGDEEPEGGKSLFAECWCQPPPDGTISSFAYGMASEVVVFVDSDQRLPAPRSQPARGWAC